MTQTTFRAVPLSEVSRRTQRLMPSDEVSSPPSCRTLTIPQTRRCDVRLPATVRHLCQFYKTSTSPLYPTQQHIQRGTCHSLRQVKWSRRNTTSKRSGDVPLLPHTPSWSGRGPLHAYFYSNLDKSTITIKTDIPKQQECQTVRWNQTPYSRPDQQPSFICRFRYGPRCRAT